MGQWQSRASTALLACCLCALPGAGQGQDSAAGGTLAENVRFDQYGAYSDYGELARRMMTQAAAAQVGHELAAAGATPSVQPIDLAEERFLIYLPATRPVQGYGLLVFVPPWQQARLPARWDRVLDQHGMIFVSAARSGNQENVMGRRAPLALLAAHNVLSRFQVDPRRVYIGGFSGGSRVALRLAVGYPDLFRGAILNAGSDMIGEAAVQPPIPLPPQELLYQFQESSHVVYVTGERDSEHAEDDHLSLLSLHRWCAFGTDAILIPRGEHAVADATALAQALSRLSEARPPDPVKLAQCRAATEAARAAQQH